MVSALKGFAILWKMIRCMRDSLEAIFMWCIGYRERNGTDSRQASAGIYNEARTATGEAHWKRLNGEGQ